jgi:RNA polymerase sigma factor (sigma-70 family)
VRSRARDAEAAVRQVYDAHYGRLVGWTTRLVGEPDLAHDFATEAFVRLIRDWDSVAEPRAWLYTATANLVRDHWRRRGREAAAYGRVGITAVDAAAAGDHDSRLTVRDAVQALPDRLRLAVLLHYFADLPVAQVATQLGKSEGTIKRDLYDARSRMAGMLEGVR